MKGKPIAHEWRDGTEGKVCTVCGEWQPLEQYNVRRASADGLTPLCRACESAKHHAYYVAHVEEAKARARKWAEENPKARAAVLARYDVAHADQREEGIARWHKWRKDHAAEYRASCYRWAAEHPNEVKAIRKRHWLGHREETKQRQRQWRAKNRGKVQAQVARYRAAKRAAPGADYTTAEMVLDRWEMYGGRCWICGATATQTDHVKPLSKGGAHWPCNLRPICAACNSHKHNVWPYPVAGRENRNRHDQSP